MGDGEIGPATSERYALPVEVAPNAFVPPRHAHSRVSIIEHTVAGRSEGPELRWETRLQQACSSAKLNILASAIYDAVAPRIARLRNFVADPHGTARTLALRCSVAVHEFDFVHSTKMGERDDCIVLSLIHI